MSPSSLRACATRLSLRATSSSEGALGCLDGVEMVPAPVGGLRGGMEDLVGSWNGSLEMVEIGVASVGCSVGCSVGNVVVVGSGCFSALATW